ncbi:hypothetical protein [Streptomyces sp. NBC_01264]|uniref:hypothetical protein n=1 Tax=Streptomyces sp. NBC_01264 TaxID=2903804 RepID=UPI002251C86C|nr:hypothetical protein [Streptomyces sp. NBC_01264]MCX4781938.1 hypothetical protein [Streptomyces sp. NBC_01264]
MEIAVARNLMDVIRECSADELRALGAIAAKGVYGKVVPVTSYEEVTRPTTSVAVQTKGTQAKATPAKATPAKGTQAKATQAKATPAKGTQANKPIDNNRAAAIKISQGKGPNPNILTRHRKLVLGSRKLQEFLEGVNKDEFAESIEALATKTTHSEVLIKKLLTNWEAEPFDNINLQLQAIVDDLTAFINEHNSGTDGDIVRTIRKSFRGEILKSMTKEASLTNKAKNSAETQAKERKQAAKDRETKNASKRDPSRQTYYSKVNAVEAEYAERLELQQPKQGVLCFVNFDGQEVIARSTGKDNNDVVRDYINAAAELHRTPGQTGARKSDGTGYRDGSCCCETRALMRYANTKKINSEAKLIELLKTMTVTSYSFEWRADRENGAGWSYLKPCANCEGWMRLYGWKSIYNPDVA